MKKFDFESLHVYQLALDFAVLADEVAEALLPGRAYLADQLRRASSSVCFNIAEGAGEWMRRDKGRFYRYARRSGTESAAVISLIERLKLAHAELTGPVREPLYQVICMLVAMVKNCRTVKERQGKVKGKVKGKGPGGSAAGEPNPRPAA
ncbi:MAG: four helix bundle protein [Planctomycetes bacterium]|nr:four helix bundle protein [Planctomycetota bacterium]